MSEGAEERAKKRSVTLSNDCQVFHAVFLPIPLNDDTVSWPVMLWNIGTHLDRKGPKAAAISCAGMYRKYFPTPNATQTSSAFNWLMEAIAKVTTPVSTVLKSALLHPFLVVSIRCRIILVSASYC